MIAGKAEKMSMDSKSSKNAKAFDGKAAKGEKGEAAAKGESTPKGAPKAAIVYVKETKATSPPIGGPAQYLAIF